MTRILHITQLSNLASILEQGGLWSCNHMPPGLSPSVSAYDKLQQRRAPRAVPVGPRGVLHDYVPFYFGERSPMLGAISVGKVPGVRQEEMIYLVSTAETIHAAGAAYVFTDGHGIMAWTRFFDDVAHLSEVDMKAVHARYWVDTEKDPDRQRRKQAEFLVHKRFSMEHCVGVGVIDEATQGVVQQILDGASCALPVKVKSEWYY